MKKNYKILIYLLIVLLFMLFSFFQWKLELNMTFETLKNFMVNIDFVKQWHYLTFANSKVFILIYPIIIIYFGIKEFFKIYHSGVLYQISQRTNYKTYIKKTFLDIYINNNWVYFAFIFLMLIVCSFLFKNMTSEIYLIGFGEINYIIFAFISAILSILFSIFILNIGLIVTRYCKKFSIAIIVSYISFIAFAIVSEILIGGIISSFIKLEGFYNSFSIFNMIILDGNVYGIVIYSIILTMLSTFVVFKIYNDKDRVLVEYE